MFMNLFYEIPEIKIRNIEEFASNRIAYMEAKSSPGTLASFGEGRSMSYSFPCPTESGPFEHECFHDHSAGDQGLRSNPSDKEYTSNRTNMSTSQGSGGDTSNFRCTDYGEPIKAQRVIIDFTPVKGVDDDLALMNKCSSFWELLAQYPNLEKLKAAPEPHYSLSGDSGLLEESKHSHVDTTPPKETASYWVEKDWIMNSALTTDMKKPFCDQLSDGYSEPQRKQRKSDVDKARRFYSRRGRKCRTKSSGMWESEQLSKEMDAWDQTHCTPKSLGA